MGRAIGVDSGGGIVADGLELSAGGQLADLHHEIKNVLSIIALNTEQLLRSGCLPEEARRLIELNQCVADRGARLLRSLLRDSTAVEHDHRHTDIDDVIAANAPLLQAAVGPGVMVTFDLDAAKSMCPVDEERLVDNLVEMACNARDAMPRGGALHISTAREADGAACDGASQTKPLVCIRFADNGYGIDQAITRRAFDPHFTTKTTGTGSGLAAMLQFAHEAGGSTSLTPNNAGGSTVVLCLPVCRARAEASRSAFPQLGPQLGPQPAAPAACRSILVLEDEPEALAALAEILADDGFDVVAFTTVAEAESALALRHFDILLSDVAVGSGDGLALAQRCNARWPALDVILMSGRDLMAECRPGEALARCHFLPKPIDPAMLRKMVAASGPDWMTCAA